MEYYYVFLEGTDRRVIDKLRIHINKLLFSIIILFVILLLLILQCRKFVTNICG